MGLLAPLFLAGLVAVALPVWLHRLQTQSSERRPFASAMLLETTQQRVHVRRKLKYLPLLLLRIGLLCLLALAFAKPWLLSDDLAGTNAAAGTQLVVVDTSVSMRREGALAAAISLARNVLAAAPAGAELQVIAAGAEIEPLTTLSADANSQRNALRTIVAGQGRLDFGRVAAAIDALAKNLPPPVTVHFISDLQQSAMPARFADLALEHVMSFVTHRVNPGSAPNPRIESLRERAGTVDVGVADAVGSTLTLLRNDEVVTRLEIAAETLLQVQDLTGVEGDNRLAAQLSTDDTFVPDNTHFAIFTRGNQQPVPVITLDAAALPYTYLSAALDAGGDAAFRAEPMLVGDFDPRVLSRYRFAVVDDLGAIDAPLEAALRDWVSAGGALLAFAGRRTAGHESLPVTGHLIMPAQITARDSLSVGRVDARHPMLATTDGWFTPEFADALPVELRAGDEVLVALENDAPLLIAISQGSGKVLLVTAGLDNLDNDFPIRPVFVGFLLEAARYLSGTAGIVREYLVGDRLHLPEGGQVLGPDGNPLLSLQRTAATESVRLAVPGIFNVRTPGLDYLVAVNIDPRESRFEAVSDEIVADWAALAHGSRNSALADGPAAPPGVIELWPWTLVLLLLFVIAESMLGNLIMTPQQGLRPGASG